jgi:hypothetical protein
LNKSISEKEEWEIIKPVCRELYDPVDEENIYSLHLEVIMKAMEHTKFI